MKRIKMYLHNFIKEEVPLISTNNADLRNFYLWAAKILFGLFGTFYLLFGINSIYHRAYNDLLWNVISSSIFFFVIIKDWIGRKNVIRVLVYAYILSAFYLCSYFGFNSGIYLGYLNLFFVIPFAYDIYDDKIEVISIIVLVLIIVITLYYTDGRLFHNPLNTLEVQKSMFPHHVIAILFLVLVFAFLLFKYNQVVQQLYLNKSDQNEYKLNAETTSTQSLEELNHLAMTNNNTFLIKFNEIFPTFYQNIQSKFPDLTKGKMEICCFIKLNYSTKEIAIATNNSIRSVDSKKYRIRKKLNLDSSENLYEFLIISESLSRL